MSKGRGREVPHPQRDRLKVDGLLLGRRRTHAGPWWIIAAWREGRWHEVHRCSHGTRKGPWRTPTWPSTGTGAPPMSG